MPKTKLALESDGPQRLEVKWKGGWFYTPGDAEVLLDGALVGTIPHAEFPIVVAVQTFGKLIKGKLPAIK